MAVVVQETVTVVWIRKGQQRCKELYRVLSYLGRRMKQVVVWPWRLHGEVSEAPWVPKLHNRMPGGASWGTGSDYPGLSRAVGEEN